LTWWLDSFDWKKAYHYDFETSGGTGIGPTPQKITYHKRHYGSYYEVENTFNKVDQLYVRTNRFFGREHRFYLDANSFINRSRYRDLWYIPGTYPAIDIYFNRDHSGLITSMTGDKALDVTVNPDLEITAVQHTIPQPFDESYTYDPRGNRLTSLTTAYTYNDLNQLTGTSTHTYEYDADGNLVEERDRATTETRRYYYDSGNRLVKYEHYPSTIQPADMVATYAYGMGKDSAEGHVEFSEASPNLFAHPNGWYSYIKDQVGTITKIFSHHHQQVVDTRTHDTFGNPINQSTPKKSPLSFQSKYHDPESNLYYFYHRYYHPTLARFTTKDPLGLNGGTNLYDFVKNDSLNYIDPFGLKCESVGSKLLDISVWVKNFKMNKIKPRLKLIFKLSIANWKVLANISGSFECKFICVDDCGDIDTKKIRTSGIPIFTDREFTLQGPGTPLGKLGALRRMISTWNQSYDDYMKKYFEKEILKQLEDLNIDADKICEKIFGHL
jgi:RHS repeat-associated protein